MTRLMMLGVALSALFAWNPAQAKVPRCMPADFIVAKARAERPSTEVLARVTGNRAEALLAAFSSMTEDEDKTTSAGDEITVLRNTGSEDVLVIVARHGCALWRAKLSRSDYEHVTWKAWGLPV